MGFLDNSGDIILDAVLTDYGRKVLSKGDGTFKIVKFALGDEEINYELYDSTNANGSAYYDLEILQTPILEAFTDNAISMKSKLVTYENLDLLYLPVVKLNESDTMHQMHSSGSFIIAVDGLTENDNGSTATQNGIGFTNGSRVNGILFGQTVAGGGFIRLDQGLDTDAISFSKNLPRDMFETGYIVQIDNRFGEITDINGATMPVDYVDDDDIAFYTLTRLQAPAYRSNADKTTPADSNGSTQVIRGPRGSILEFKIRASLDLNTSTYLFNELGSTSRLDNRAGGSSLVYHIDSIIRVTGVTTGYTVDIPVRFVKFKST
jgi:hypothetical protein|tara:strand:- start:188 stop:1147 length:960 start_codon:yes stop_codon:yes gene_type:complete